jgi:hypothetical protein
VGGRLSGSRLAAHWRGWAALGAGLLLLGAKVALLDRYASPVPFMDEWDGALAWTLKPYLEHAYPLAAILEHHNEHRFPLTHLLIIALYDWTGTYDVVLQMLLNATIHAVTLAALALWLARPLSAPFAVAVVVFTAAIGWVPFGWESLLMGFNTHFYLLIAASLAALVLLDDAAAFSRRWWLGWLLGGAATVTLASGALALCPAIGVVVLQMARGQRRGGREVFGIAVLAATSVAMVATLPSVPTQAWLHAQSLGEFIGALSLEASWPLPPPGFVLILAPLVVAAALGCRSSAGVGDAGWRFPALLLWLATQIVAIAYGRVRPDPIASRYLDLLVVGQIASVAAAAYLADRHLARLGRNRAWVAGALIAWTCALVAADIRAATTKPWDGLMLRAEAAAIELRHLRAYLIEGDADALSDAAPLHLPYPVSQRLKMLLDDPTIRAALPGEIVAADGNAGPEGGASALKRAMFALAVPIMLAGGLLLAAACAIGMGATRRSGHHAAMF